ncbi:MAG TPA: heme-binding domain-containing protein [Terriglobales bacterium]|jgi:mono/diheme cytochrome c family protein
MRWLKWLSWALIAFVAIQFIPFGHTDTNPPVIAEPHWDSPQTRALFVRACFDCHSNQTTWPWYSHVAPVSWLVERDVLDGRRHLNFTQWNQPQPHAQDVAAQVRGGGMPLWFYLPMHPAARLSPAEKQALIAAAAPSLGPQHDRARK